MEALGRGLEGWGVGAGWRLGCVTFDHLLQVLEEGDALVLVEDELSKVIACRYHHASVHVRMQAQASIGPAGVVVAVGDVLPEARHRQGGLDEAILGAVLCKPPARGREEQRGKRVMRQPRGRRGRRGMAGGGRAKLMLLASRRC